MYMFPVHYFNRDSRLKQFQLNVQTKERCFHKTTHLHFVVDPLNKFII